jgi:hypothetical protein
VFVVASHFALGLFACLPRNSKIWSLPVLRELGNFYRDNRLDQSWSMFAPPPRTKDLVQYSLHLTDGWTSLIPLNSFAADQVRRRFIQPRGMFRVMAFSRSISSDKAPGGMTETSARALYYQQLSDYFCRGDGLVPGLVSIRFYIVGSKIPYYLDTDRYGQPLPPISDYNYQLPIYEQECASD